MKRENVNVFAITGGPGGGKTTGLAILLQKLREYGVTTFAVPEVATLAFSNGGMRIQDIKHDENLILVFQKEMLKVQLALEQAWLKFAELSQGNKKVVLTDRGVMDGFAYITDPNFFGALIKDELGLDIADLRDERYDSVFFLVSAAKGAEEYYKKSQVRYEDLEEARKTDTRTLAAWEGHKNLRVIGNEETINEKKRKISFEGKMNKLLREACRSLEMPVPLRKERVLLVDSEINPETFPVPVVYSDTRQLYLESPENVERRIRERRLEKDLPRFKTFKAAEESHGILYTYTERKKREKDPRLCLEHEEIVSAREYCKLIEEKDRSLRRIRKWRCSFVWENQYIHVDLYVEPVCLALLQVELTEEQNKCVLPPFVKVVEEVTDDERYGAKSIAAGLCPSQL